MYYVIVNKNDDQLFWSNEFGWVGTEYEDHFTEYERNTLSLPLDGVWCVCFD